MAYRTRQSPYPVGTLLLAAWRRSGQSLGRFLAALGYGNVAGGCRAFDEWVTTGGGSEALIERFAQSPWAPEPAALATALLETQAQLATERDAEARKKFRPMIQARPEWRVPGSIMLFGLTGGYRRETCYLPASFAEWDSIDQDAAVREWVTAHYHSTSGRTRFLGFVTGYWLFLRHDEDPWLYSVDGERLRQVDERPIGAARLEVGGRRLPLTFLTGQ